MATRHAHLALVALVVVVALSCLLQGADAFAISPQKVRQNPELSANKVKAIRAIAKRTATRTKRYTDFQLNAQSFCTGLCMYEEKKSYNDCYDVCNGYWDY